MRLRSTTATLSMVAIATSLIIAGCGGGSGGDNLRPPSNADPQIQSITAPSTAFPGSRVSLTANATDPDGDSLSYAWSANSGIVEGSGATVTWTAPVASADCTITVTVTDGKGGQAQESVTIAVDDIGSPPPPPWPPSGNL